MILLTGGLYPQLVFAVIGGFACSVLAFVLMLKFVIRRKFNTPEFKELATSERIIRYVILIIASGFIAFVAFYFFAILFAWIATGFGLSSR